LVMRAIDPSLSYAAALKTEPAERKIEDTNVHRVVRTGWPEKVAVSEIYLPADDLARVVDLAIALGRPLLLAVSRKDFIGAITGRAPRGRLAGTLAAVAHGVDAGAHLLRVHDVREVADFLAVRAVLRGESGIDPGLRLADELRWEQSDGQGISTAR